MAEQGVNQPRDRRAVVGVPSIIRVLPPPDGHIGRFDRARVYWYKGGTPWQSTPRPAAQRPDINRESRPSDFRPTPGGLVV